MDAVDFVALALVAGLIAGAAGSAAIALVVGRMIGRLQAHNTMLRALVDELREDARGADWLQLKALREYQRVEAEARRAEFLRGMGRNGK